MDMKEFIARVAQVEKEMGEEEKKETEEEKTEIREETKEDILAGVSEEKRKLIDAILYYTYFRINNDYIKYLASRSIEELKKMLEILKSRSGRVAEEEYRARIRELWYK